MIRKAIPEDGPKLAKLIMLAMGTLANKFVKNPNDTLQLFERFTALPANQYSYENILVWDDGTIQGLICGYDGALLHTLRNSFLNYIKLNQGISIIPEDETQAGEFYIDCLAVFPHNQGKGIGRKLIIALKDYAGSHNFDKLGLLVNTTNPDAKKLYLKLGFVIVDKRTFVGDNYDHLQLNIEIPTRGL